MYFFLKLNFKTVEILPNKICVFTPILLFFASIYKIKAKIKCQKSIDILQIFSYKDQGKTKYNRHMSIVYPVFLTSVWCSHLGIKILHGFQLLYGVSYPKFVCKR